MKIKLIACILLCCIFSCTNKIVAVETSFFTEIRDGYLLDDKENVYEWEEGNRIPHKTMTYQEKIKEQKLINNSLQKNYVLEEGVLYQVKYDDSGKETKIKLYENVKKFLDETYKLIVLKNSGELFEYFIKSSEKQLIMKNVLTFDAFSANKSYYHSEYYVITNDQALWHIRVGVQEEVGEYLKNNKPIKIFQNAKNVLGMFNQVWFLDYNENLFYGEIDLITKRMKIDLLLSDVVDYTYGIAIRKDGTLWYWDYVPGQPKEHHFQAYTYVYESQNEPVMLSFDPKVNESYVPERMKNLLSDASARRAALNNYPEYYLTNYREHFTKEEIEQYATEYLKDQEQKSEAEEASQQLEKEQRLTSPTQESSLAAATATQDKQSSKLKSDATPIIIVILVLFITVGVDIVYKQKKK